MTVPPAPETKAWEPYGELVAGEVERQEEIKTSLEGRGNMIITSSAALVTLLFALTAVVTKVTSFKPSDMLLYFVAASLGLFAIAAFCGLAANWPLKYKYPLPDALRELTSNETVWTGRTFIAQRVVADLEIDLVENAVSRNQVKAFWVTAGFVGEVSGVVALAIGLILEIWPAA